CQCRREFPGLHQQREIPRNDLADDTYRLMARVAEIIAADRDRLALNLVGPAGVVAIAGYDEREIGGSGDMLRFAIIERFKRRQLVGVFLDQVGQTIDEPAALGGGHAAPVRLRMKCLASSFYGEVDI